MPKKPKSGPPYTDVPDEPYVVVSNPWGMNVNPRSRSQKDFDRVASWAQLVLQQAGLGGGRIATIECIYSMGTRDEIILQFQDGTDIIPLLGEHRWVNIAKDWTGPPNDPRSTRVFIYNWRNNGDPANHNWAENFPRRLSLDSVPAKSPYPGPSWTQPPSTLTNFVHSIPRPPVPPPMPNDGRHSDQEQQSATSLPPSTATPSPVPPEQHDQPEPEEQPVAREPIPTNLFKPYEPPSHAQLLNQQRDRCDEVSSSRASPPSPKFVKKLDPYELEEDALNALHSFNPAQEDTKDAGDEDVKTTLTLSVKSEPAEVKTEDGDAKPSIIPRPSSQYQPSQSLIDAFNSLTQPKRIPPSAHLPTHDSQRRPNTGSQTTPPASLGYQPSAKLEAEVDNFLLSATAAASSSFDSTPRSISGTRITIKREHEEDSHKVVSFVRERKRIKVEEF